MAGELQPFTSSFLTGCQENGRKPGKSTCFLRSPTQEIRPNLSGVTKERGHSLKAGHTEACARRMPVTKEEGKNENWKVGIVPQTACAKAQRRNISVSVGGTHSTVCVDQQLHVVSVRGRGRGGK